MGKIFCLMGKSASGKDTIYNRLLADQDLGLHHVVLYTTRPIRKGEVEGQTYHFCREEQAAAMEAAGKVIEMRAYNTVHGVWKYFTADDGQIQMDQHQYLMIGTLEAFLKMRTYFGAEQVIPIYISVDDGLRLSRALEREREQEQPKYAELCRRFLADEADFSEEKKQEAGIEVEFENRDLDQTIKAIAAYVKLQEQGEHKWQDLQI